MRDFHKFVEEMSSGQIDQEMKARTLRAFQIAEEIHQIIMPKAIKDWINIYETDGLIITFYEIHAK